MRIIIHGLGAIGGVTGAALALAGHEVIGIARGRMLEAVRTKGGLELESYRGRVEARLACVAHPGEIRFRDGDMVLLCVKGQDTVAALEDLRAAGMRDQPLFCCQNGVENERVALRYFGNVHGVTVMMPAGYREPGAVTIHCQPRFGTFELGRYVGGHDGDDAALAEALDSANVAAFLEQDVMAGKYGKLLLNLGNIVGALLPEGADSKPFTDRLKAEAEAVYRAARIDWREVGSANPRRDLIKNAELASGTRSANSTRQSLARAAGSVETDYLNGEIALLGRLHGVPTPLNQRVVDLSISLAGGSEGSMATERLEAEFQAALADV